MTILFLEKSKLDFQKDIKSKLKKYSDFSPSKFIENQRSTRKVSFNPQAKFYTDKGKYNYRFISEFKSIKNKYFNPIVNYFGTLNKQQYSKLLKFCIHQFNLESNTTKRPRNKHPSDFYYKEYPPCDLLPKKTDEETTSNHNMSENSNNSDEATTNIQSSSDLPYVFTNESHENFQICWVEYGYQVNTKFVSQYRQKWRNYLEKWGLFSGSGRPPDNLFNITNDYTFKKPALNFVSNDFKSFFYSFRASDKQMDMIEDRFAKDSILAQCFLQAAMDFSFLYHKIRDFIGSTPKLPADSCDRFRKHVLKFWDFRQSSDGHFRQSFHIDHNYCYQRCFERNDRRYSGFYESKNYYNLKVVEN